jgi:N-methylhydantoinase B
MRGVTMMRNMATCLGLLNVATGGQAMAAAQRLRDLVPARARRQGELFLLSDGLGVGYGARPTADGNDAVYLVAQENFPSEFLDSVFPCACCATPSIRTPAGRDAGAAAAA